METYKIDVIEDSEIVGSLLKYELEKDPSYFVEVFLSGEDYLSEARNPDLVILDYFLDSSAKKSMNGIAVLKEIKKIRKKVPIVFFSSQNKLRVVISALKKGATDYVSKDSDNFIDDIVKSVKDIFAQQKGIIKGMAWRKAVRAGIISLSVLMAISLFIYITQNGP